MKCPDCGIKEFPMTKPKIPPPKIPSYPKFADIKPNIAYPRIKVIYYGNIGYFIVGIVIGSIVGSLIGSMLW